LQMAAVVTMTSAPPGGRQWGCSAQCQSQVLLPELPTCSRDPGLRQEILGAIGSQQRVRNGQEARGPGRESTVTDHFRQRLKGYSEITLVLRPDQA
jgi:hypothetical protein